MGSSGGEDLTLSGVLAVLVASVRLLLEQTGEFVARARAVEARQDEQAQRMDVLAGEQRGLGERVERLLAADREISDELALRKDLVARLSHPCERRPLVVADEQGLLARMAETGAKMDRLLASGLLDGDGGGSAGHAGGPGARQARSFGREGWRRKWRLFSRTHARGLRTASGRTRSPRTKC